MAGSPAAVPGIFTKLLDVDKVDIVMGDYGTNLLAPAMPIVIQKKMTFFALFGMDVNKEFKYERYFSMQPAGSMDPAVAFSKGFFEVAAAQNPRRGGNGIGSLLADRRAARDCLDRSVLGDLPETIIDRCRL